MKTSLKSQRQTQEKLVSLLCSPATQDSSLCSGPKRVLVCDPAPLRRVTVGRESTWSVSSSPSHT